MRVEDGPFASDSVTNTYQNRLRTGLALQQPTGAWTNGLGYDGAARLTNVVSQAGSFHYSFAPGAQNPVSSVALPNTAYITNTFDAVGRLTGTYLKNSGNTVLNKHEYVSNVANQRTQETRTDGTFVGYTYDNIGQLAIADSSVTGEDCGYSYDKGWNLSYLTNAGSLSTFRCNSKSELLWVNNLSLTYDGNGNLLTNAGIIYIYDDENRLVTVACPPLSGGGIDPGIPSGTPEPDNPSLPPSTGGWRSDFAYDGLGRLRIRQDAYSYTNGWYFTNVTEYIYDGTRVIQERDGNNAPKTSYTWGRDLSGTLEGAGGISGLLARSHGYSGGIWASHDFYHADGGGNITCMINGSQAVVASYRYDPFGNLVSSSGTLAGDNLYRFSSKEFHANSGMSMYLYRFYDPRLQRWINRDPAGERGGINLYAMVANDPLRYVDPLGLKTLVLNFGFDNSVGTSGNSGTVNDVKKSVAILEQILARCCDKFPQYCGIKVAPNYDVGPGEYDAGDKPAPKEGYKAEKDEDLNQFHSNLRRIRGGPGGVPILITNKHISKQSVNAGGFTEAGFGILLDVSPPPMGGGGLAGLAHELGHAYGYDSSGCGPYVNRKGVVDKEHSGTQSNVMFWNTSHGTDPDQCYCKALYNHAK